MATSTGVPAAGTSTSTGTGTGGAADPPALTSTALLLSVLDPRVLAQHAHAGGRGQNKASTLRRARERRVQVAAELERARVELWETTMEMGALGFLAKDG